MVYHGNFKYLLMFRRCRKIDRPVRFATDSSVLSLTNVRVPSAIDSLLISREMPVHSSDKCIKYQSDVYFLLNQKRLDKMSLQAFSEYLDSMPDSGSDSLSELRSKVSDAQLLQFVKSRYIQSRSELQAWASYLSSQAAQLQGEAKVYVDSLQPAPVNSEPVSTGE